MWISKRQRATINSAVKPFNITSNYLGPGIQKLIKYYSKYFTKRRFSVAHFIGAYKNSRNSHFLTVVFNKFLLKGGFAKKRHPITWKFYGNLLLTKYGKKKQQKKDKKKRKHERQLKLANKLQTTPNEPCKVQNNGDEAVTHTDVPCAVAESHSEQNSNQSKQNVEEISPDTPIQSTDDTCQNVEQTPNRPNDDEPENNLEKSCFDDEAVDNIWNLDLQKVAALITEGEADDKLSETKLSDKLIEESAANENCSNSAEIDSIDTEPQDQQDKSPCVDINEQIREQLKLLKKGKSDNFLYTKEGRNTSSPPKQSSSNSADESKRSGSINLKSVSKSPSESSRLCGSASSSSIASGGPSGASASVAKSSSNDDSEKSKSTAIGGMIESLFNKIQSRIGSTSSPTLKSKSAHSESKTTPFTTPAKKSKRDESSESVPFATTHDSNQEDSNQSAASVSMEFLGFDISNKNVDVSALLPTPKVSASNSQAAFVSEYLDMFMKENLLEKSNNDQIASFAPKRRSQDEALITIDALPPNLSVRERPLDMQRPRTLAEKRMILQQQNDISILIIENESTVYHELKKRVKQGSSYDNSLMQSIQDAHIPFTRDCWRAACWIATSNNHFFYRTIIYDGEEIKLTGSRGDNAEKVALDIQPHETKPHHLGRDVKYTHDECAQVCLPIGDIKINNIDSFIGDVKVKTEDLATQKLQLLNKCTKLNMFSKEYLTPGPKSKKAKCKSNRTSSFDLEYGPLELVRLPTVQLEVWPQVNLPLPDCIKTLLKTIPVNTNVITPEWAKFAVSVVKETPKQIKHRRKYKKPEPNAPESIVFNIPYENDEKKILMRRRRRSSITFSKDDAIHEQITSFYQDDNDRNELEFAKVVDPTDSVSVECANILTSMIHSVAIAVNDSNFIKQDPDIDYVGKVMPIGSTKDSSKSVKTEKDKLNAKETSSKTKLIKELKRLNVTVIDTADTMTKSKKVEEICQKPYCKFGCVCGSIDSAKYIQTHCRLYNCMFSCDCVDTPYKQGNAFCLNNNIGLLQARANACLAKEEKEFKSTIIVSENDMFVLPSSSIATKRHSKKPKRFTSDESCLEDTETETIFKSKRRRSEKMPAEPCTVTEVKHETKHQNGFIKKLQHVRVDVKKLPDLEVEPWCLVHCLYKCHCKGRAQKGRIFNFANKKNDMTAPGGWDVITPRKRQYTFERENIGGDEPSQKARKVSVGEVNDYTRDNNTFSSRTVPLDWRSRPRKNPQELNNFRNRCIFEERPFASKLREKIMICRKYNQAQNMLTKTMENGKLTAAAAGTIQNKLQVLAKGKAQPTSQPLNSSLQRLNHVITKTMHSLTALQERSQLLLNPTPNKLSIVPWNRVLQAFKSHEVFIWDVILKDDLRLLVLTQTHVKPKSDTFQQVTNINHHSDISSLPMIAKLLRNEFHTEKTKYLAMILLRVSSFWRICGVLHSDLKYMDDELRAKPTPDQNPFLGRKINMLYQLLTNQMSPKTNSQISIENAASKANVEDSECEIISSSPPLNGSNAEQQSAFADDECSSSSSTTTNTPATKKLDRNDDKLFFENTSMRLCLPIPVDSTERLLMLNVGDDFTHIWFKSWNKFLSMKRIKSSLALSKQLGKAIEMSQSVNPPKVFVSSTHDNFIFIGPYGSTDRQNVVLFVKHDSHITTSEKYYEEFGEMYTRKTKATWVYPTCRKQGNATTNKAPQNPISLKINQVFSKHDMPSEFELANFNDEDDCISPCTTASDVLLVDANSGGEVATTTTTTTATKTNTLSLPNAFHSVNLIGLPSMRLAKPNVISISNPIRDVNPLPFKITSVASGEGVALMTNGLSVADSITDDESNSQPKFSDVQSLANHPQIQDFESLLVPKQENDNENANDSTFINTNPKMESIDISDDEQQQQQQQEKPFEITNETSLTKSGKSTKKTDFPMKGYIYCSTNSQLGKVKIEWASPCLIKLFLLGPNQTEEINCDETNDWHANLTVLSLYMHKHIRKRFYGVYPSQLKLSWVYVKTDYDADSDTSHLCDLISVNKQSIVFKDKIVHINSNYREDAKLPIEYIYVVDIYKLASQTIPEDEVKSMKIHEIIKKCRDIDAELLAKQNQLKKNIHNYRKCIQRNSQMLAKQSENQNGKV